MQKKNKDASGHGRAALDLSGRTFGRLTVVSRAKNQGSLVCWNCRCKCGRTKVASSHDLKLGRVKSCGCMRRTENIQNIKNNLHYTDGTCLEYLMERKERKDNTSGRKGVVKTQNEKYRAYIDFKGKRYMLGTFSDFEGACKARSGAEELLHKGFVDAYRVWQEKASEDPSWAIDHPFVYEAEQKDGKLTVRRSF